MAKDQGARALFANASKMSSRHPRLDAVRSTAHFPAKATERTATTTKLETLPGIMPA